MEFWHARRPGARAWGRPGPARCKNRSTLRVPYTQHRAAAPRHLSLSLPRPAISPAPMPPTPHLRLSRSLSLCALLALAATWVVSATPDREVLVHERVLGSGRDGYAVLRTESDNLGLYYSTRVKTCLDLYDKAPSDPNFASTPCRLASTTLLLDVTHSLDPDGDPSDPAAHREEVHHRDDSVSLTHVFARFPSAPTAWDGDQLARLSADPDSGLAAAGFNILWGGWVKEHFGCDRNAAFPWRLDGVLEDGDTLYLQVSAEPVHRRSHRIVALPPDVTVQVRAHLSRQPAYLVAGSFNTESAAVAAAQEMLRRCRDQPVRGFQPAVWSARRRGDAVAFLITSPLAGTAITSGGFDRLEEVLGAELSVEASAPFLRYTPVRLDPAR